MRLRLLEFAGRLLGTLAHVRGLRSFLALHNLELDGIALLQAFVAFTGNGAVVDENVGPAFASDEPVSFGVIEPLNCTFQAIHVLSSEQRVRAPHCPICLPFCVRLESSVKKCKARKADISLWNSLLAGLPCLTIQPEDAGNRFRVLDGSFEDHGQGFF